VKLVDLLRSFKEGNTFELTYLPLSDVERIKFGNDEYLTLRAEHSVTIDDLVSFKSAEVPYTNATFLVN
jgi:hypothetical protein